MDNAGLVVPTSSFPKSRLLADGVAFGPEVTPMPFNDSECGLPRVLSVMAIAALRGPNCPGVKVGEKVQLAPATRLEPHVVLFTKSALLEPVSVMPVIATVELPVWVSVSVCGTLALPTNCVPKSRLAGERVRVSGSNTIETVNAFVAD